MEKEWAGGAGWRRRTATPSRTFVPVGRLCGTRIGRPGILIRTLADLPGLSIEAARKWNEFLRTRIPEAASWSETKNPLPVGSGLGRYIGLSLRGIHFLVGGRGDRL